MFTSKHISKVKYTDGNSFDINISYKESFCHQIQLREAEVYAKSKLPKP